MRIWRKKHAGIPAWAIYIKTVLTTYLVYFSTLWARHYLHEISPIARIYALGKSTSIVPGLPTLKGSASTKGFVN